MLIKNSNATSSFLTVDQQQIKKQFHKEESEHVCIPCNCIDHYMYCLLGVVVDYEFVSFSPITTKFNRGFPPCRFSSSALILIICRAFPERPGVGTVEGSSPFDPLDGVSGCLDVASEEGVVVTLSGLAPRRTEAATTPLSPVLR